MHTFRKLWNSAVSAPYTTCRSRQLRQWTRWQIVPMHLQRCSTSNVLHHSSKPQDKHAKLLLGLLGILGVPLLHADIVGEQATLGALTFLQIRLFYQLGMTVSLPVMTTAKPAVIALHLCALLLTPIVLCRSQTHAGAALLFCCAWACDLFLSVCTSLWKDGGRWVLGAVVLLRLLQGTLTMQALRSGIGHSMAGFILIHGLIIIAFNALHTINQLLKRTQNPNCLAGCP